MTKNGRRQPPRPAEPGPAGRDEGTRPSGHDGTAIGLAAIDNAGAVDPPQAASTGPGAGHRTGAARAAHPELAGTVAGVGATEVERRRLSQAQMEEIVRVEIADRETAAAGYERAGQLERAERLRAEAKVLRSHLDDLGRPPDPGPTT